MEILDHVLAAPTQHPHPLLLDERFKASVNINVLKAAYDKAKDVLLAKLATGNPGCTWFQSKATMEEVQQAVLAARSKYESSRHSKARKWLSRLSLRVHMYGNVLDVLVQHHPEYVSLVWGAFKFVFTGIVNHEELLHCLSKALSRIADALSTVELQAILYPTSEMQDRMTNIYVDILQFMQRAADWYSEGKLRHIISSITRPYSLRFEDLVHDITENAHRINQLALTLAFAEQRRMREEIKLNNSEQRQMREEIRALTQIIVQNQSLNYAGALDTNRRVCEIQFSQILSFVSDSALEAPELSRRHYVATRNRRRRRLPAGYSFESVAKVNDWSSSAESSILVTKAPFRQRDSARDFAADAIELVEKEGLPVVWALCRTKDPSQDFPVTDVLKQLVHQVLQVNHKLLDEKSVSLNAARFQSAVTLDQWLNLLASSMNGMPQLYIVVDAQLLKEQPAEGTCWPTAFSGLFESMRQRNIQTVVKLVFVSYGPAFIRSLEDEESVSVVRIQDTTKWGSARMRLPTNVKKERQFSILKAASNCRD